MKHTPVSGVREEARGLFHERQANGVVYGRRYPWPGTSGRAAARVSLPSCARCACVAGWGTRSSAPMCVTVAGIKAGSERAGLCLPFQASRPDVRVS